jgi:hypothetical protein
VFLRMASYYVAWHMKEALAPVLFKDDDKEAALAARPGPLAPAARSPAPGFRAAWAPLPPRVRRVVRRDPAFYPKAQVVALTFSCPGGTSS